MRKKQEKIIPLKNYFNVAVMFIAIFAVTLIATKYYKSNREYELSIPVVNNEVYILTDKEIENYITAHDSFLLYISVASDTNSRKIEKGMVKLLENKNLKESLVYLNITDLTNKKEYLEEFMNKRGVSTIVNYPLFAIVQDGQIVDYVYKKNNEDLTVEKIKDLLDKYGMGD